MNSEEGTDRIDLASIVADPGDAEAMSKAKWSRTESKIGLSNPKSKIGRGRRCRSVVRHLGGVSRKRGSCGVDHVDRADAIAPMIAFVTT